MTADFRPPRTGLLSADAPQGRQALYRALAGLVLLAMASVAALWLWSERQIAAVEASQAYLAAADGSLESLRRVARARAPLVYYHVVLQGVPWGRRLSMRCEWLDPAGTRAHENRYRTRRTDKVVWPTHCRYQFRRDSPIGSWTVKMFLDERVVSESWFEVGAGEP